MFRSACKLKPFFITILSFFSFALGLAVGVYKLPPFQLITDAKYFLTSKTLFMDFGIKKFEQCQLSTTTSVIEDDYAIIGHAYGSPRLSNQESFLSLKAETFIKMFSSKLKTLIFTGDVFKIPSREKWEDLRSLAGEDLDILIAPGNHDVARPDSKNVFTESEFGSLNYPSVFQLDNTPLVLENSTESSWHVMNTTIDLLNELQTDEIIIARHHSPVEDLLPLVNSKQGKSTGLETIEELSQKLTGNKKYFWLIGDSGAHAHLPRLTCLEYQNHIFILNGLGDEEGDSVILYRDKNFLEYRLSLIH